MCDNFTNFLFADALRDSMILQNSTITVCEIQLERKCVVYNKCCLHPVIQKFKAKSRESSV